MWPFQKKELKVYSPVALRDKLIEAAESGRRGELRSLCQQYKSQVAEHLDTFCKIPEGMSTHDGSIDRYCQCLGAVAQCLAQECGAPELLATLCGNPDDNPLVQWERWYRELPERMRRLEYEALIDEARSFIDKAKTLVGVTARQNEAFLYGRLGTLLFHSGRVAEAVEPFRAAWAICVEIGDIEGQLAYLSNLLEVHCWLDDGLAVQTAERLLALRESQGQPAENLRRRMERLRHGEPLCRVVCVRDGREMELDELSEVSQGSYQFVFRRNRIPLDKAVTLTEEGNRLATSGAYSDAMEKYREASEVDPFDPDPIYQSGMCLLELGAYAKAREAFEEVDRMAPGWFRCRTDRWLAEGLEAGTISDDAFRVARMLEDGGLDVKEASAIAAHAMERFPDYAPLQLLFGNLRRDCNDTKGAEAAYRKGLELVEEPDLESRLLCALAGILPCGSPERMELVNRAVTLQGSLVAQASARMIGLL